MTDSFLICFLVSFFFFFVFSRYMHRRRGIRGDEFGSPILSEIDRMEKKKGERREKDNNNMGGEG